MLELANIRKAFNQGQHNEYWALKGIDLEIPPARVNVLKGPSGSGKTTLLTILGCLARPTEGRVRLKGEDISGLPERFLTEIRRSTFGFIFQQFNLVRGLSAIENIILPGYPTGATRRWNGSPAASSSAWRSAARSSTTPRSSSPTSPPPTSTASSRPNSSPSCGGWPRPGAR